MRHLMSPLDFTVKELSDLFDLAEDIEHNPAKYSHACAGKSWRPASTNPAPGPV